MIWTFELKHRTEEERHAFYEGVREGIRMYAWWKDGEQYVGSCGTRLSYALEQLALLNSDDANKEDSE